MNTPSTTPPSDRQSLDHFETALLGELREHVATRPARPARRPERPRRGKRVVVGIAAAAAAATAYVVVSPGGPAVSPAYAVTEDADGDVVVTVHRLEDSDGLEAALRAKGIDADVSFDPMTDEDGNTFHAPDGTFGGPPEGGQLDQAEEPGTGGAQQAEPGIPDELDFAACGTDGAEPATLSHEGDDWVLRIPADSILQDRAVQITTGPAGTLGVFYEGETAGLYCGVMSLG